MFLSLTFQLQGLQYFKNTIVNAFFLPLYWFQVLSLCSYSTDRITIQGKKSCFREHIINFCSLLPLNAVRVTSVGGVKMNSWRRCQWRVTARGAEKEPPCSEEVQFWNASFWWVTFSTSVPACRLIQVRRWHTSIFLWDWGEDSSQKRNNHSSNAFKEILMDVYS